MPELFTVKWLYTEWKYILSLLPSVTGPLKADWMWRDGRVWPFEAAPFLWHHLLEWSTHTDTPQADPIPASHVWGWWGLLWKRKRFFFFCLFGFFCTNHRSSDKHHLSYFQPQYDDLLSQFSNMQVAQSSSSHSLSPHESTPPQRSSSNIEQYIHDLDNNSFELDLQFTEEEKQLLLDKQTTGNPW